MKSLCCLVMSTCLLGNVYSLDSAQVKQVDRSVDVLTNANAALINGRSIADVISFIDGMQYGRQGEIKDFFGVFMAQIDQIRESGGNPEMLSKLLQDQKGYISEIGTILRGMLDAALNNRNVDNDTKVRVISFVISQMVNMTDMIGVQCAGMRTLGGVEIDVFAFDSMLMVCQALALLGSDSSIDGLLDGISREMLNDYKSEMKYLNYNISKIMVWLSPEQKLSLYGGNDSGTFNLYNSAFGKFLKH